MAATPARPIDQLLTVMARLRDPQTGCPWDVEQSFATIAPYTIEEAYEVADAIERGAVDDLRDELGDLLLQVVFHARIAEEARLFAFDDVARAIVDKLVRRHPHVFGEDGARSSAEQTLAWEAIKAEERQAKGATGGLLDDIPSGLPGLTRAVKLTKRAGRVGFDWPRPADVLAKIREELLELEVEIKAGDPDAMREEFGDFLFACANLARKLDIDPEDALRAANAKFMRRFGSIEAALGAQGRSPQQASLDEMEALWSAAKQAETTTAQPA